jgi:hypothetical protein
MEAAELAGVVVLGGHEELRAEAGGRWWARGSWARGGLACLQDALHRREIWRILEATVVFQSTSREPLQLLLLYLLPPGTFYHPQCGWSSCAWCGNVYTVYCGLREEQIRLRKRPETCTAVPVLNVRITHGMCAPCSFGWWLIAGADLF